MNETGQPRRPRFRSLGDFEFFAALGELRAVFGIHIAQLAVKYGIDVEDELAAILPIEDEQIRKTGIKRS